MRFSLNQDSVPLDPSDAIHDKLNVIRHMRVKPTNSSEF